MSLRYLFGPVSRVFAEQNLAQPRRQDECLAFNLEGNADLAIRPGDSWGDIYGRLPQGWQPDVIVLSLAYTGVPAALWTAAVPLVTLATDLDLLWHYYRRQLRRCELVLADAPAAELLDRAGAATAGGGDRAASPGATAACVVDACVAAGGT